MVKYKLLTPIDNGNYIISNNTIGALSIVSGEELIMLGLYDQGENKSLKILLSQLGYSEKDIPQKISLFEQKLDKDGWLRNSMPQSSDLKLQLVYLNLTTDCNYKCIYCYQGANKTPQNNQHPYIALGDLEIILGKIKKINPNCEIVVTGGEPFLHSDIFKILEAIEKYGFHFAILTNGSLINEEYALKLSQFQRLNTVQISIDGITEGTHNLTRGKTFHQTMTGIKAVIKYQVPFTLAPTIHNGNLEELYEIAYFAYSNKGNFSPNTLRKLPHLPPMDIELSEENLLTVLDYIREKTNEDFRNKFIEDTNIENLTLSKTHVSSYVCGTGHSVVEINWNCNVYPCHLLSDERFKLGNLKTDTFKDIFDKAENIGIRKMSYEIDKCKNCHFMTKCAGGCKACAFYTYGSFNREDPLCEVFYKSYLNIACKK